jgi:hypothetical protein
VWKGLILDSSDFKFLPSAFKHGVSEDDSLNAVLSPIFSKIYPDRPIALIIGFDKSGKTIEVVYDIETRTVFHAMPSKGLRNRT